MLPALPSAMRLGAALVLVLAGLSAVPAAQASTYAVVHRFEPSTEGSQSQSTPVTIGQRLYGMTYLGGPTNSGAVYTVDRTGATTLLHVFDPDTEGANPAGDLLVGLDGALYGTTQSGPGGTCGALFRLTTAGSFTVLHAFSDTEGCAPVGRLAQAADGTLFGAAYANGAGGAGTVWSWAPGGGLSVLHAFTIGSDGVRPVGGLAWDATSGTLYGTTILGGGRSDAAGTVFAIVPGASYRLVHVFTQGDPAGYGPYGAPLIGRDGALYLTSYAGGAELGGTALRLATDGTVTVLHTFTDFTSTTNGAQPMGTLAQGADGTLYGTTYYGGASNQGSVWRLANDGSFRLLHAFAAGRDGAQPIAGVLPGPDGKLYGVTTRGGNAADAGVLFQSSAR